MRKKNGLIAVIAMAAVFIAVNSVLTILVAIPMPGGQGYLNLSDALIMLTAGLIHPVLGAIVGALSGAISDLALGYGVYVPFTFFIKGLEGLMVGYLLRSVFKKAPKVGLFIILPTFVLGGSLMMTGYFLTELTLYGLSVAVAGLYGNFIQGLIGAAIAGSLFYSLYRLPIYRNLSVTANASFLAKKGV